MSEGKLKSLTLQEKIRLINLVENGRAVKEVAEEYSVNRNTLFYILKNREKIRESVSANPGLPNYKRIKTTKSPDLERRVLEFMMQQQRNNQKLSGGIIKNQALEIAMELQVENFGASNGWLHSFFKRNNISIAEFNKGVDPFAESKKVEYDEYFDGDDEGKQEQDPLIKHEVAGEEPVDEVIETVEFEHEESDVFALETEVEEETVEEYEPPIWLEWCRICGNRVSLKEVESEILEYANQVFQISSKDVKICRECNYTLEDLSKLNTKARMVESMLEELQNRDKVDPLSEADVADVRLEYGLDYDASSMVEDYIEDTETETVEKYEPTFDDVVYEEFEGSVVDEHEDENVLFEETFETEEHYDLAPQKRKLDPATYHYECHICHEIFEQMCFLSNHTRIKHQCLPKVECTCGCGRFLSTWESLMAHRRKVKDDEKTFTCDVCDMKFSTQTGLKIHAKFKHERPVKNHECPECGRTFKDGSILKAHIRTHLPEEEKYSFECEICGKKMVNKWSLKYHIDTIHEKIQKHFCSICGRGFGNKSNLRSHLISHSTENVVCGICNGVFKNRISLQSHKKIHKPESERSFACSVCNKTFHNRNHLSRHMISHSDQRVYRCEVIGCSSEYKWPKDLKNHMSAHSGERPYKCMFCNRDFTDGANMRKHKLKDHPNELAAYENEIGKRKKARAENRIDITYEEVEMDEED